MLGRWCGVFYTWIIPNALIWRDNEEVVCSKCRHPAKDHRNRTSTHQEVANEPYERAKETLEREIQKKDSLDTIQGVIQEELDKAAAEIEDSKSQIQALVAELNQYPSRLTLRAVFDWASGA
ncbi:hypothetical protein B0J17DRAFT_633449 [Rhizoctonia solani]|nr:hypothetical protein B0J17DRAFT_633449 [Rhizoctonia solani]